MAEPKIVTGCISCRYGLALPEGKMICRRNPPMPVYDLTRASTDQYVQAIWPMVEESWWCGEYKQ